MRPFLKSGTPFIWLTGGALSVCLLMIAGLVGLVAWNGAGFFWPRDLVSVRHADGRTLLGEVWDRQEADPVAGTPARFQLKVGNRDVTGADFIWVDERDVVLQPGPEDAVAVERQEWGDLYGTLEAVSEAGREVARGPAAASALAARQKEARALLARIDALQHGELAEVNARVEALQRAVERVPEGERAAVQAELDTQWDRHARLSDDLSRIQETLGRVVATFRLAGGQTKDVPVAGIVRLVRPNAAGLPGKCGVYLDRLWTFVAAEPRESNTEGGVFPAIFGTVMMVFLMSLAAVPFGVLAALYLREYARQGVLVRTIRIAVNNLAGVPSIVFGMFGLGFFVYGVGGMIDQVFFADRLPTPTFGTGGILWASLTLALLTVPVMIVATEEALAAVPREVREGSLALGATQLQTILRVVLPGALPGMLTGVILVIARGAGEVAPLMITGVVKLAPSLPVDGTFPFLHLERKFMHLGFHIYDVGFQSPNVEAARPMVYTTTLLLMGIVLALNTAAILVRSRVRKRLTGSAV